MITLSPNSKVYIHIGYHKTGSTFLQERIFAHLPMNRWITPQIDSIAEKEAFSPELFVSGLISTIGYRTDEDLLFSSEILSGRSVGNRWDPFRIAERLRAAFPGARILAVIRHQYDYLASLYAFRVCLRGLERRSFADWLALHSDEGLRQKLCYDRLVSCYQDLFGREAVTVLPYEQLRQDPAGFVTAVARFLERDSLPPVESGRVNSGIRSEAAIHFHRRLNCVAAPILIPLHPLFRWMRTCSPQEIYFRFKTRFLNPALAHRFAGPSVTVPEEWRIRLEADLSDSNRRLQSITGLNLAVFGYPGLSTVLTPESA